MIVRTFLATAVLGLALAASGHAASTTKDCGLTPRINGERLQVVIEAGKNKTTCASVKRVMTKYLRTFKAPKPWYCQLGHSADAYAASCGRSHPSVAMKAFAPN